MNILVIETLEWSFTVEKIAVRFTFPFEGVILQKFFFTFYFQGAVPKVWASKIVP